MEKITLIDAPNKSNTFLCIKSINDYFTEGQLYSRRQIINALLKLIINSDWIISQEQYRALWKVLKISNKNSTILFIPIFCTKCHPKFDDDIPIQPYYKKNDKFLTCRRCESIWDEEAFKMVLGTPPHLKLTNFARGKKDDDMY